MKKLLATLLGALVVSALAACGGGPAAPEIPDTPEGAAFQFRTSLMNTLAWKVAQARAMAQGEIPVDEALFAKHANDIATLGGMLVEGFVPNSAIAGSAALPEVWTNMADFRAKAQEFQSSAQALATAAQQNGFEAAKGMVQAVGSGCGNCHRPYRRRQE